MAHLLQFSLAPSVPLDQKPENSLKYYTQTKKDCNPYSRRGCSLFCLVFVQVAKQFIDMIAISD